VGNILQTEKNYQDAVKLWTARHATAVGKLVGLMHDMETQPELDYAMAAVALRALSSLAVSLNSNRGPHAAPGLG
ncbi:MAG: hypothetical protein ACREO9_02940, partial [Lysobacterales bacterium]